MKKIFAFLLCALVCAEPTLVFVIEISRHGARMPSSNPSNFEWVTKEKDLTSGGMRQKYLSGRALRKRYVEGVHKLLSPVYNPNELLVLASNRTRVLASARAQLAGLYPENAGKELPKELADKAVPPNDGVTKEMIKSLGSYSVKYGLGVEPIITSQADLDFYLLPNVACKSIKNLTKHIESTKRSEIQEKEKNFSAIIKQLKDAVKVTDEKKGKTIGEAAKYRDVLISGVVEGAFPNDEKKLLKLINDSEPLYIYKKYDLYLEAEYKDYSVSKIMATPFLKRTKEYLTDAANGRSKGLKYVMNVVSDSLMQAVAYQMLGKVTETYVEFASALFIELYRKAGNPDEYEVRVVYNREAESASSLKEFIEDIDKKIYTDAQFEKVCHTLKIEKEEEKDKGGSIVLPLIISGATLVLVGAAIILWIKCKSKSETDETYGDRTMEP